jgi:alkyl hydroperoxide reductase subunit AhpC
MRLGQIAPDFEQDTVNGSVRLHTWIGGSWAMLFSYCHAFDPVVSAELAEVARLKPEWDRRSLRVIGLSTDTPDQHQAWELRLARPLPGDMLNFPVVTDSDGAVSRMYGLRNTGGGMDHAVFVIDPLKRLQLIQLYPANIARNFSDLLRLVDSLQAIGRAGASKTRRRAPITHGDARRPRRATPLPPDCT